MSIYFPGDKVTATRDGERLTGTIRDFTYGVADVANVCLSRATDTRYVGEIVAIPVADLESVTR